MIVVNFNSNANFDCVVVSVAMTIPPRARNQYQHEALGTLNR